MDFQTLVVFTRSQLTALHNQLVHPSSEKLFNFLKWTGPEQSTGETFKTLQDISNHYDACQKIKVAPTWFRIPFGAENVLFNGRIILDILTIYGGQVIHIVDEGKRFSASHLLPDMSTKTI